MFITFDRGNEESNIVAHGYEKLSITVPEDWVEIAGGPQAFESMLHSSIACYLKLRNTTLLRENESLKLDIARDSVAITSKAIKEYLFSFRQLLLALVSVASSNTAAFPSENQKVSYVTTILESLTPVFQENVLTSIRQYHPKGYPSLPKDYFSELQHQEFEHVVFILIRLFGLFRISVLKISFLI